MNYLIQGIFITQIFCWALSIVCAVFDKCGISETTSNYVRSKGEKAPTHYGLLEGVNHFQTDQISRILSPLTSGDGKGSNFQTVVYV
jgi:hypothetical protein